LTGFVSAGTGSKPTPLPKREVEKILVVKKEEAKPQVAPRVRGGRRSQDHKRPVRRLQRHGQRDHPDLAKLKVLVNISDRDTPVEFSFHQVAKV
jgi:transcription termination/antitermination protein NusG